MEMPPDTPPTTDTPAPDAAAPDAAAPAPDAATEAGLDPAVRDELDMVRLLIEHTRGVIVFVRYRRVAEREAAVRYLRQRLRLPFHEFTFAKDRLDPLPRLRSFDAERACVHLYDVEAALPRVAGVLNLKRGAFAEVPHALIVWVGDHGLRELARHAPDFFAWRSGVFDARTDAPEVTRHMTQTAATEDLRYTTHGDLERRASFYAGLIEEHAAHDDPDAAFLARMNCRLAEVSLMLRRLDDAERAAEAALAWANEADREAERAHALFYLGRIADERRGFAEAERWYRQALEIYEQQDNMRGAAATYHQLGMVAEERRAFDNAEQRYRRALEIAMRQGDEQSAASTYYHLGCVAQGRQNPAEAERWFEEARRLFEQQGNDQYAANAYHSLGTIAEGRRDLEEAERWYRRALKIRDQQGDEHNAANSYHHLGHVAEERLAFEEAIRWYCRELEIRERLGDNRRAAITCHELARIELLRPNYAGAVEWLTRCAQAFARASEPAGVNRTEANVRRLLHLAPAAERPRLKQRWRAAGLPPVWDDDAPAPPDATPDPAPDDAAPDDAAPDDAA
jgi:tetratricopeptide (TPR) repeat protein